MFSTKSKIAAVGAVTLIATGAYFLGASSPIAPHSASAAGDFISPDTVNAIYTKASPAVVEINVTEQGSGFYMGTAEAQGSGFLVDTQGHIVTNNHVVDGATSVQVLLNNGNTVTAQILGTDPNEDLAVIKVDPSAMSGVTPLTLADSNAVKPGDLAIAIGSPYGLQNSVTAGVISGLARSLPGLNSNGSTLTGMLQTDAAINPGNSGGPLLNINGQVIGINTAIETQNGAKGIGFAVPSSLISSRLSTLEAGQQVAKPWLGISGSALTQTSAQTLNLPVSKGVYVIQVMPNSPASVAGLVAAGTDSTTGAPGTGGDIITAADGKSVASVEDLSAYLNTKSVGNVVNLTVIRGGKTIQVSVTLQAWPANLTQQSTTPNNVPNGHPNIPNYPRQTPSNPNGNGVPWPRFRTPTPTPQ